jgi:hypothetical protein
MISHWPAARAPASVRQRIHSEDKEAITEAALQTMAPKTIAIDPAIRRTCMKMAIP